MGKLDSQPVQPHHEELVVPSLLLLGAELFEVRLHAPLEREDVVVPLLLEHGAVHVAPDAPRAVAVRKLNVKKQIL
jgi:hypothetical protein